jgi:hypothetical protein
MATVKFRYSSMKNISFHGVIDSGIDREDWNAMEDGEKTDTELDLLAKVVDLSEIED